MKSSFFKSCFPINVLEKYFACQLYSSNLIDFLGRIDCFLVGFRTSQAACCKLNLLKTI